MSRWRVYTASVVLCMLAGCGGGTPGSASLPSSTSDAPNAPITPQVVQQNNASHFVEFAVPAAPNAITQGPDGNAWFSETQANAIGSIAYNGVTHQYALPNAASAPTQIATGADGNLWFIESGSARIAKMTLAGAVTEYALPAGEVPLGITAGPSSSLWFTASSSKTTGSGTRPGPDVIGRLTTTGVITRYNAPVTGGQPGFITSGADGALWFTDATLNLVGRMTTSGNFMMLPLRTPGSGVRQIISAGSAMYFVEHSANKLGTISMTGMNEYANTSANSPTSLAAGSSGSVYLLGSSGVQSFNTVTHAFSAPLAPPTSAGLFMSPESDGNLWFTESGANTIGVYVLRLQTTTPTSIAFTAVGQTQTFSVHELNYSGAFTAVSSNTAVASVSAASSPANTFTVTALTTGTASINVSDSRHNTTTVSVTVTTTAIVIQ